MVSSGDKELTGPKQGWYCTFHNSKYPHNSWGTVAHVTNTLCHIWKIHFILTQIQMKYLLQNFAHAMTAMLSWHAQNCSNMSAKTEIAAKCFSIEFEWLCKNHSCNGSWVQLSLAFSRWLRDGKIGYELLQNMGLAGGPSLESRQK